MIRFRCVFGIGFLVLSVLGCGDDHAHEGDAGHPSHDGPLCGDQANCVDTVDLVDGVEGHSESGVFMARISSQNGLNVDANQWMVMVTEADGSAVEGADVEVQTHSVDCDHPGPCPESEGTEHMPGMYMITPVHAHGGPWNTELMVHKDGQSDKIVWRFCVAAPSHGDELPPVTCPDGNEGDSAHGGHADAGAGDQDAGHADQMM